MDTKANRSDDDLSDLESRLMSWKPTSSDLESDRMLFLAGRAAARPGRAHFLWPVAVGSLGIAVMVLGQLVMTERSERIALARQLHRQEAPRSPTPSLPADYGHDGVGDEIPVNSLLASHRILEQGLDEFVPPASDVGGPPMATSPILRAWQPRGMPDL